MCSSLCGQGVRQVPVRRLRRTRLPQRPHLPHVLLRRPDQTAEGHRVFGSSDKRQRVSEDNEKRFAGVPDALVVAGSALPIPKPSTTPPRWWTRGLAVPSCSPRKLRKCPCFATTAITIDSHRPSTIRSVRDEAFSMLSSSIKISCLVMASTTSTATS
jgi:hypothetical protein